MLRRIESDFGLVGKVNETEPRGGGAVEHAFL
jgi:hypothetical protein